ncbi:MAG: AAC(3) family N-acetyltransferase [Candidatus Glassbacteria bacterium]|nr:AAC(3) family N-acetyltransferase [Candidatus Glassbacteria bacterium]
MIEKKKKEEYPPLTAGLVEEGLRAMGLGEGDVVFVHSSVKDFAPARQLLSLPEMGMQYVLEGMQKTVGPQGLLAFPTFSFCYLKRRYGPTGLIWEKKTTPSKVGDMTNYFLGRRGVRRSDHPSHSVAAWGGRAEEFVAGHSYTDGTTFHPGSPWGRLCEWDGYILFYGTYLKTCTMIHAVEDWMKLPYLTVTESLIKDENDDIQIVKVTGSPSGCRDFYNVRDTKIEKLFLKTGFYRTGRICMAEITLFKARDLVRWLWRTIMDDPWVLLHRDPDDKFCWAAGRATEEHISTFNEPCPF